MMHSAILFRSEGALCKPGFLFQNASAPIGPRPGKEDGAISGHPRRGTKSAAAAAYPLMSRQTEIDCFFLAHPASVSPVAPLSSSTLELHSLLSESSRPSEFGHQRNENRPMSPERGADEWWWGIARKRGRGETSS
jgi:hypothetical protein